MVYLPDPRQQIMSYRHLPPKLGLPQIGQLGFLVNDVEHTCLRHGGQLGVSTWYRASVRRCEQFCQGRLLDQRFKIAIGYSEGVQIEVFQVDGADRSLLAGLSEEPRLNHVGFFVGDMRATRTRLVSQGYATLQCGSFSFVRWSKTKVAYLDTLASLGVIVELIENRFRGWRIDMPEWYVRLGVVAGQVTRI